MSSKLKIKEMKIKNNVDIYVKGKDIFKALINKEIKMNNKKLIIKTVNYYHWHSLKIIFKNIEEEFIVCLMDDEYKFDTVYSNYETYNHNLLDILKKIDNAIKNICDIGEKAKEAKTILKWFSHTNTKPYNKNDSLIVNKKQFKKIKLFLEVENIDYSLINERRCYGSMEYNFEYSEYEINDAIKS